LQSCNFDNQFFDGRHACRYPVILFLSEQQAPCRGVRGRDILSDTIPSSVAPTDRIGFLGFVFKGTRIVWSDQAFAAFRRRVKKLTGRSWFVSMKYRLHKLAEYLRGWMGYYGLSEHYSPIDGLDGWIRRRIRMCYWKQWRRCRTKVRELVKLGTSLRTAISVGLSRKGPWHLARTLATQTGMTNQWLAEQGLISVKELWVNIHYPATAR
jgi:RNA-directed DNA polymerase